MVIDKAELPKLSSFSKALTFFSLGMLVTFLFSLLVLPSMYYVTSTITVAISLIGIWFGCLGIRIAVNPYTAPGARESLRKKFIRIPCFTACVVIVIWITVPAPYDPTLASMVLTALYWLVIMLYGFIMRLIVR